MLRCRLPYTGISSMGRADGGDSGELVGPTTNSGGVKKNTVVSNSPTREEKVAVARVDWYETLNPEKNSQRAMLLDKMQTRYTAGYLNTKINYDSRQSDSWV